MERLQLGTARENITPEIGCQLYGYLPDMFSEAVADDLTATAFYFRQNGIQVLMVNLTLCTVQTELAHSVLSMIEQRFGIPKENCMLCTTHTHTGPNVAGADGWGGIDRKYCDEILIPGILAATEKAMQRLQPVKMGVACGDSLVGVNRRVLNEENKSSLGQNPAGCFNRKMTVLAFVDDSGNPVANMIHYGAHATAAGHSRVISRDWPGPMVDAVENHSGGITAFFNGPEGDAGPRLSNGKTIGDMHHVRELGAIAARDAVKIFDTVSDYSDVRLAVSNRTLPIPLEKRMPAAEAAERLEEFRYDTANIRGMLRIHFEDVLRSYEEGFVDEECCPVEQTVIALGDIVFAAFPYELFSKIGMDIDSAFEEKSVLSLSNTNGYEGYFITKDAISQGGYEVNMFLYGHLQSFCGDASRALAKETINHIKTMEG